MWDTSKCVIESEVTAGHLAVLAGVRGRFEPGHPLRGAQCLICGKAIGGAEFVTVTTLSLAHAASPYRTLYSATWIIHETETPGSPDAIATLVMDVYGFANDITNGS